MTEKIVLAGAAETLLATLYARAVDAQTAHPVLGDMTAAEVVDKLDYDFRRLGMRPTDITWVAIRAKLLDRWSREFLAEHPDATVLHLGCGLDNRVQRLDPGPGVRWFDVDQPEVIELRERLYPARAGYHTIGASVTDRHWLAEVPGDLPTLVVAEGLTMYLPPAEGPPLLRRLIAHFPSGEMAFDTFSRLGVRLSVLSPLLWRTGVRLAWGIDDPRDLEREVPGLRLRTAVVPFDAVEPADLAHQPWLFRLQLAAVGRFPMLGRIGHVSRFAFGAGTGAGR